MATDGTRRRSRRLADSKRRADNQHHRRELSLEATFDRSRHLEGHRSDRLQLVPVSKSLSPSRSHLSSSQQIVMQNSSNRTMILHNQSTRQLSAYQIPIQPRSSSDDTGRDLCPLCLRPLYDFDQQTSTKSSQDEMRFSSNLLHAQDYFARLGQMHLLEQEKADVENIMDQDQEDECLSEQSFNSGYYARFFKEQQKLGSGGYGAVFLCSHLLDGVTLGTYAIKKIPVGNNKPWLNRVLSEVRAVESLRHPNIIDYKHSWLEITQIADFGPKVPAMFMLMECANMGNVADYVSNLFKSDGKLLLESDVWLLLRGVAQGLRHLHHSGIIHRDIKPENLLLNADYDMVSQSSSLRIMISDFGESETLKAATRRPRTGNTGTLFFCAPELLLDDSEYGDRADIYSLGIVLYFMAFGHGPYDSATSSIDSPEQLHKMLASGSLQMHFAEAACRDADLIGLIRSMTSFDSADRPSIDDVLRHPRLKECDQNPMPIFPGRRSSPSQPSSQAATQHPTLLIGDGHIATTATRSIRKAWNGLIHALTQTNPREYLPPLSQPILQPLALILHQLALTTQASAPIQVPLVTALGSAIIWMSTESRTSSLPRWTRIRALKCLLVSLESVTSGYPASSAQGALVSASLCLVQCLSIAFQSSNTT